MRILCVREKSQIRMISMHIHVPNVPSFQGQTSNSNNVWSLGDSRGNE